MYTNIDKYGGNFLNTLKYEFKKAENVSIASGYVSLDIIEQFKDQFINIAKNGGKARLLLGMAFYEGLNQKKLDASRKLNDNLKSLSNDSGVFVTNGRKYHGKVYHFNSMYNNDTVYVGSANFSYSGTKGNIECVIPVIDESQKGKIISFIDDLYSFDYAVTIDNAKILVPNKTNAVISKIEKLWNSLEKHNLKEKDISHFPNFRYELSRVAKKEKSNLNVYFGRGRWSRKTNIIKPRPWYEIELIANIETTSNILYPKGDFYAYTDDGIIIPMRTQGDYHKNIRSKDSLQLFGIWLKGKLEKSGVLQKYQPITSETLEEYGKNYITFSKMKEKEYFLSF